jgi:UDP-N-acetylmuramate-alanine ligase
VFDRADKVIIGPIFKARDNRTFGMSPGKIIQASGHLESQAVSSLDQIRKILKKETKSGDVIIVMGAGKSYLWSREILKSLT